MSNFLDRFLEEPLAVEKMISFLEKYRVNREYREKASQKQGGGQMLEELTLEQLKKEMLDVFPNVQWIRQETP